MAMLRFLGRSSLFAALLVCLAAALPAATPPGGTLNAPPSGQASQVGWTGGPYTFANPGDALPCTSLSCDSFLLTVNVPDSFYTLNPNYTVDVQIHWASNTDDFDLFVLNANGDVIAFSAQGLTNFEDVDAGRLPSGTYTVQIVASTTAAASYSGTATLGPEPTVATGRARYKPGKFTFSSPIELDRPNDVENSTGVDLTVDQDVEPRVAVDPLGNIYVAAIQGVPGGTDVFKSMDGGQTFAYLGEPDGAQVASLLASGAGVGGGDEDMAIGASGNVYVNSLWLGSSTQCTSFDGGTTWAVNPFSTDLPADDRQWIASEGQNIVYLTYKQLGTLTSGTESIFVAKSFDAGLTFPQITKVTTPEFGVQPGFQGNIAVDPNNGYVYTVFVGANANELYLARSTDGGQTFILKLAYQAPTNISLENVFPVVAIDRASNLYIVFSNSEAVYLTTSTDQGGTWSVPVLVSNGPGTKTGLEPWAVAGSAGEVNIVWLGTPSTSNGDPNAQWQVFFAQSKNALDKFPTFSESSATGVMHTGAICVFGTACTGTTRNLAEYFTDALNLDGTALIAYPDDQNSGTSTGSARTFFVKQTGGPTLQ